MGESVGNFRSLRFISGRLSNYVFSTVFALGLETGILHAISEVLRQDYTSHFCSDTLRTAKLPLYDRA